jgi:hypothetical protein
MKNSQYELLHHGEPQKNEKRPETLPNLISSERYKQQKLDGFPSELLKEPPRKSKEIIINNLNSATKFDETVLTVEFKLVPSKIVFSKIKSTLWFDRQEVKSDLIGIPQSFGDSDEFQLNYILDMRGISTGNHTIKVELTTCFHLALQLKKNLLIMSL